MITNIFMNITMVIIMIMIKIMSLSMKYDVDHLIVDIHWLLIIDYHYDYDYH